VAGFVLFSLQAKSKLLMVVTSKIGRIAFMVFIFLFHRLLVLLIKIKCT
jgi:hypothetical protein